MIVAALWVLFWIAMVVGAVVVLCVGMSLLFAHAMHKREQEQDERWKQQEEQEAREQSDAHLRCLPLRAGNYYLTRDNRTIKVILVEKNYALAESGPLLDAQSGRFHGLNGPPSVWDVVELVASGDQ